MANTYVSFLTPVSGPGPAEPRSGDELNALLNRLFERGAVLELISRKDVILAIVLALVQQAGEERLSFLRLPFQVLQADAIGRAVAGAGELLRRLAEEPRLAIDPFLITLVDGTIHQPHDAAHVLRCLQEARELAPPCSIGDEYFDLELAFSFLKSMRGMLERASQGGVAVAWIRVSDMFELLARAARGHNPPP